MIKDIQTANSGVQANTTTLENLHRDFPQCFNAEGKFDIERFKSLVSEQVDITQEGYDLNFLGKNYARLISSTDSETVIVPDEEHNSKPENKNSQNIYISGDNLDALKHLRKSYREQIKCIYIDPPYNTGSDGFVYNDSFNYTKEELVAKLSISESQAERILSFTKKGSSSHSAWLTFMACRLIIARDLLTQDGVIFISIDDNEQANLKLLCDSVFGEDNCVAQLIWETGKKSMAAQVAVNHEYCLVYCFDKSFNIERNKNTHNWSSKKEGLEAIYNKYDELKELYKDDFKSIEDGIKLFYDFLRDDNPSKAHKHYNCVDSNGLYFSSDISQGTGTGGKFDIVHPITKLPCKVPSGGWRFAEDKLPELLASDRIVFGKDEKTVPCLKRYLRETEYNVFASVFYKDGRGASKRLETLMDNTKVFNHPKDEEVIARLIQIVTQDDDAKPIVMDFFSGSATTAHAVMCLNKQDGKQRKMVSVQLPENLDSTYNTSSKDEREKIEKVIKFLDSINKPHSLDEIGQERIRRAAAKIKKEMEDDIQKKENELKKKKEEIPLGEKEKQEIADLEQEIADKKGRLEKMDFGFKHYTLKTPAQNTLDMMEEFNPDGTIPTDFIQKDFGNSTILSTWLCADGYGLNAEIKPVKLQDYTAYLCGKHLYFLDVNLSNEDVVKLVELYGNEPTFCPQNWVLFGYGFNFSETEMLKKNAMPIEDGKKNIKVNVQIRY